MRALVGHSWPGNIRELQNYIARGVILSNDGIFEPGPFETCEPEPEILNPTLEETIRKGIIAASEIDELEDRWSGRGSRQTRCEALLRCFTR
jgi:DNA-binding NtrC family response regulator